MPSLIVIAGPNGAGKSRFVEQRISRVFPLVNPDIEFAEGRAPTEIAAGKRAAQVRDEYFKQKKSFALETTFTGKYPARLLAQAKKFGFRTQLVFIGVDHLDISAHRVRSRHQDGGHDVPYEDQKRRFSRSMSNFQTYAPQFDRLIVLDNSYKKTHAHVLTMQGQKIKRVTKKMPDWYVQYEPAQIKQQRQAMARKTQASTQRI